MVIVRCTLYAKLCATLNIIYHLLNFIESFIELCLVVFSWKTSESTWIVDCCLFFNFPFISFRILLIFILFFSFSFLARIERNFVQMKIELLTNNINWIQFQVNSKHKTHLWMQNETNEPKWNSIEDGTSAMHKWNKYKIIEWYVSTLSKRYDTLRNLRTDYSREELRRDLKKYELLYSSELQ